MVLTEFSVPNAFYDNLMKAVPEEIHWNWSGIYSVLYIYHKVKANLIFLSKTDKIRDHAIEPDIPKFLGTRTNRVGRAAYEH